MRSPSSSIPPLPGARFDEFRRFVAKNLVMPWTVEQAAQAAASVLYALGEPSAVPGSEEIDALARWLAIWGTDRWIEASRRVRVLAKEPVQQSASFARGDLAWGFGEGAWAPAPHVVKDLNAWCHDALSAFYAAETGRADQSESAPPGEFTGANLERSNTEKDVEALQRVPARRTRGEINRQQLSWGPLVKTENQKANQKGPEESIAGTILRLEAERKLTLPGTGKTENRRRELARELKKRWHEFEVLKC